MTADLEHIPEERQNQLMINYEKIEEEYKPSDDDTDDIRDIKEKIFNLPLHQRKLLLLWIDTGSYSAVAKIFNCSAPTISKYIKQLREEINI